MAQKRTPKKEKPPCFNRNAAPKMDTQGDTLPLLIMSCTSPWGKRIKKLPKNTQNSDQKIPKNIQKYTNMRKNAPKWRIY